MSSERRPYAIVLATVLGIACLLLVVTFAGKDEEWISLDAPVPKPMFKSGPIAYPESARTETSAEKQDPERWRFSAPRGTRNVALGCPVTTSSTTVMGDLSGLCDGVFTSESNEPAAALGNSLEWVQLDLGSRHRIWRIFLFRDHVTLNILHADVIVQLSDDPSFTRGVETIFNNDFDNSAGQGAGKDVMYLESNTHPPMQGRGTPARFVRVWSKPAVGSYATANGFNEIAVYGSPLK